MTFMPNDVASVAVIRLPVPRTAPRIVAAIRWSIPVVSITAPNIIADRISQTVESMPDMPPRDAAWALLCDWTQSEPLRKHGRAVEGAVGWYAQNKFGVSGPELETWRAAGLLHDFDYERFPETHPLEGAEELRRRGYSDELVQAVLGHGDHTGVPRTTPLARTVYACDEMSGFVIAVALVRPNRSLDEVDPRAVAKKMKDKGFARTVNRDDITGGAEVLGVDLDKHIAFVIEALKPVAGDLGIGGTEGG